MIRTISNFSQLPDELTPTRPAFIDAWHFRWRLLRLSPNRSKTQIEVLGTAARFASVIRNPFNRAIAKKQQAKTIMSSITMMTIEEIRTELGWTHSMIHSLLQDPDSNTIRRCKNTGGYTSGHY